MNIKNLILTTIILLKSISSFACECVILPYTDENKENYQNQYLIKGFKEADFIFYGEVIKLIDREIDGYSESFGWENPNSLKDKIYGNFPLFNLIKTLKGKNLNLTNKTIQIYQDWSTCDMTFEKNKKYIVFGYIDQDGKLKTSICAPNRIINSKKEFRKIKRLNN